MKQWLLTHRGALLSAEAVDGQSNLSWALPLWQEAPHCRSWDNPTGMGNTELYGVPGTQAELPDLSATRPEIPGHHFIFHGMSCWGFSTTNSSPVKHPPCYDVTCCGEEDVWATP